MSFPCVTASITVAVRTHGFIVLDPKHFVGPALPTRLQPTPYMMFLFFSSQFLIENLLLVRPTSFRPALAGKPLPFASSYRLLTTWQATVFFLQRTFTSLAHTHVGRTQASQDRSLPLTGTPLSCTPYLSRYI